MLYDILVTKQPANVYLARPILMPELVVSGTSEAEVLVRVQSAIAQATTESRIIRINVPSEADTAHDPWFRFSGMWGDTANWDQFDADIAAFRREIDQQRQNTGEVDANALHS